MCKLREALLTALIDGEGGEVGADLRVVACVLLEMALSFLGILTNLLGQSRYSTVLQYSKVQCSTTQYSTLANLIDEFGAHFEIRGRAGNEVNEMHHPKLRPITPDIRNRGN